MSRCKKCGRDYDRDRLASLAITLRGLYLCGDPFPVSAIVSLPSVREEYLYINHIPDVAEAGGTEMANASNILVQDSIRL
jgi:putative transposase